MNLPFGIRIYWKKNAVNQRESHNPANGVRLVANDLRHEILRYIDDSPTKLTFGALKRQFCLSGRYRLETFKQTLAELIHTGKLSYAAHFGQTFIEISFNSPQQVSPHIVVKPPTIHFQAKDGIRVVDVEHGSSFGSGEHPTTQLSIQLLDCCLLSLKRLVDLNTIKAVDIGTGSGILAIVAVKLGVGGISAIDVDPCAVFEARRNVLLNHVQEKVVVEGGSFDRLVGGVSMMIANLRTPTLLKLGRRVESRLEKDAMIVLSGMRTEEASTIIDFYAKIGFSLMKSTAKGGWNALCLTRGRYSKLVC
jgi:ribosomal protein L11 methyltransferase